MGLDCKMCEGERELPVWYVKDSQKTAHFSYDLCPCTGKTDRLLGERKVTEEEFNRLKKEWENPAPLEGQSFQVAA